MAEKLLEIGSKFGDYTVVKLLGRGGMGEVYKITDGQTVYALKIMSPDRIEETGRMHEWRKRFAREAEAAMAIRHPNLVAVYDVGEDPQTHLCYILMEYVGGGSLSELIKAKGRLPIKEAVSIMVQAANGLSAAHKYGIVHRDIKPDNIMFDSEGTPKLMDLGIARFDNDDGDTTVTKTDMIIGTPAYMSPEQMMNSHNVDARADIYSLGVVLYEMLTGTRPRAQSTIVELLAKAIKGEELPDVRELRPEVSASLAYALSRLVALKASERPQSAAEAAKLVYDAVSGKILVKKPKKLVVALLKRRLRSRIKNLSMIAAGLVGLAGMVMFGLSLRRTGTVETVETVRREVVVTNKINVVEKVYVTNSVGKTIPVESPKVQETPVTTPPAPAPAQQSASPAPAFREVPLASVPPEFKQDLEALGKRVSGRSKNGRLVFGRLQVEDGTPDDVATWVWLNPDGTFTATAIMALQRGIVFMKHGYEPLVVKLDGVDPKWRNDVAIDLGTVVMKKLPPEKTATLMLTPRLPEGVESGTFILRLVNNDPCGFDWGTMGRERPSRMVATTSFRNGETLKLPGCTPTLYSYTIEAPGCPTYSSSRKDIAPGENDLGEVMLVRNKTASFAIRPLGETGGEWKRQKVLVNGSSWLVLTENKDSVGNRCLLYLAAYEKSGKGVNSHFGWGNTTCEDLGEMTVKEFERREKSGDLPAMDDKKQNFSLLPGHIYRLKNDWHWKVELLVAFEDYSENASKEDSPKADTPKEDAPKEPERAVDLSKVLTCKTKHHTWRYCLTDDGGAVLVGLDRVRNGVLNVPSKLDGHKVVAIGADAFAGCRSLTGIVLPDTIEEFGPRAFYYCSQLAEIKFPKSLRKMGDETFKKCHKLKRVNISMYSRQTEQEPIASQFRGCDKLERIDADPDNPVFVSVAGVLYSKDKTALVLYPHVRKGVNLLPSVRIIDRYAFAGWRGGDHIKLPEGVVEVRARAFEDAGRLSTVEFPRSLRRLGGVLFKDTSFGKVVFHGDAPERIPSEDSSFAESRSDFVVEVERGSKGWNRWNTDKCFHKIRYIK